MAYLSMKSKLNTQKYKGKTVKEVADIEPMYLIWLHNSFLNLYLGKSVFLYLNLWESYKNTPKCKALNCLNN